MTRKSNKARRSDCPINLALESFGDRWSLLVIRDLMFKGCTTFKELLGGGEGIATNVLTDRLEHLERNGILDRRPHPSDARRVEYRLTKKGIDLAPMLTEMILWTARHEVSAAPPETIHEMTEHRKRFLASVRKRWEANQSS